MKKDLKNYLGVKAGTADLIPLLFKSMGDAHISHLLQKDKTLARHNAFSDYYTCIGDMIDTFTETYMGMNTLTSIVIPESTVITEPVKYFNVLYKQVGEIKATVQEGYLVAQIENVEQLIAHTLYKFRYIKT